MDKNLDAPEFPQELVEKYTPWINAAWDKVDEKMRRVAKECYAQLPYTAENGKYDDMSKKTVYAWTNGFWPGLMWLLYIDTKQDVYRNTAENAEAILDKAFDEEYECLNHDVGFMWSLSSGVNYQLFGGLRSKLRTLKAAGVLASRFNANGGFIRAWNGENREGYTIIDCMMNIPLLYRASEITGDPRFSAIADSHAALTMHKHVRADGSVYHVLNFDPITGELLSYPPSQGYDSEKSAWSRGQAWAIYGFTLAYCHSHKIEYLDTAKRVSHYFIANLRQSNIPPCDFRAPKKPVYYDTSAGLIAACGMLEIARCVNVYEKELYFEAALAILKETAKQHVDFTAESQYIVEDSTEAYFHARHNIPMVYADYYFTEALYKLRGNQLLFW